MVLTLVPLSCSDQQGRPVYYPQPTSLEELFSGFSPAELQPADAMTTEEPVVIIATGHLYPLLDYPDVYRALIRRIAAENPDYFFNLGDAVYNNTEEEWEAVFSYSSELESEIYFSPGNHDLNYHYERYFGKRDNQVEAEMRYLKWVGYRYRLLRDNVANYVFINANDSVHRILSYLEQIKPALDTGKLLVMLSSQALWINKQQDPGELRTWVNRPFHRDEILPHIDYFDYLIHGDWGGKFFRGKWKKSNGTFEVMAVGNRKAGDSLYITKLEVYRDSIASYPIPVDLPEGIGWYK